MTVLAGAAASMLLNVGACVLLARAATGIVVKRLRAPDTER